VERIAAYERQFNCTIDRKMDVLAKATKGRPYPATARASVVQEALDANWDGTLMVPPSEWELPAGAFGESVGPV
jgi:hypothetical protein